LAKIAALGLDVGRRRIGVAGCDGLGLFATGITTIHRTNWARDMAQLAQLVAERQVNILVVGLPYNMDGSLGYQGHQVQKFAERCARHLNLDLEYVDERLTSYEAEQLMLAEGLSLRDNRSLIDRKAAAIILQQWLDQLRARGQEIG
jgi:putative Holliday junction resolvase